MRFTELLAGAQRPAVSVRGDAEVTSITADSRRCLAGSCFVAVRGPEADGHKYISAAVASGASSVVCEDDTDVPAGVACAVLSDTRSAAGPLAQMFYGWPSRRLVNIGVTGTKGKSTITYLIRAILEKSGNVPALLGTIAYDTGVRSRAANNTTPGAIDLAEMMAEMVANRRTHLVMEVSSHALHQGRVSGVNYAAAVFTNLTGDHLDYHKTMEEYGSAKAILFRDLKAGAAAVINADDPAGEKMAAQARAAGARVILYGLSPTADLYARVGSIDESGTQFDVVHDGKATHISSPLIGRHNLYNCLAAAGACAAIGVDWSAISLALSGDIRVPGRLERVAVAAPYCVFVDYAHTDDALKNVLSAARPLTRNKLIVLFGCGGNRDRTKRPRMAKVAQELADVVILTTDNPRHEQPQDILDEIVAGLSPEGRQKSKIEIDRRKAIELAISMADEGDVVILAGKGHENYQIVGDVKTHFDDLEEAAKAMHAREQRK